MKTPALSLLLSVLAVACGGSSSDDGSGGSGASSGAGGSAASSGTGGGGAGGTGGGTGGSAGGAPGGGGAPCSALADVYLEQLAAAKACNSSIDVPQCTVEVADALECPCGPTFVNPGNTSAVQSLKELQGQWDVQQCSQGIACPEIACATPTSAVCEPGAADALDSCKDVFTNGG